MGRLLPWRDRLAALRVALGLAPAVTPPAWHVAVVQAELRRARLLDGEPPQGYPLTFVEALTHLGVVNFNSAVQRIPAAAPGAELTAIRIEMTTEALRYTGEVAGLYEGFHVERSDWLAALRHLLGVPTTPPAQPVLDAAAADLRALALID